MQALPVHKRKASRAGAQAWRYTGASLGLFALLAHFFITAIAVSMAVSAADGLAAPSEGGLTICTASSTQSPGDEGAGPAGSNSESDAQRHCPLCYAGTPFGLVLPQLAALPTPRAVAEKLTPHDQHTRRKAGAHGIKNRGPPSLT